MKIVICHTVDFKPVNQEVNSTVILPPLVFPGLSIWQRSEGGGEGVIYEWAPGAGVLKKLSFYLINFSNLFLEGARKKVSITTLPFSASIYEWALTFYSNTGGESFMNEP